MSWDRKCVFEKGSVVSLRLDLCLCLCLKLFIIDTLKPIDWVIGIETKDKTFSSSYNGCREYLDENNSTFNYKPDFENPIHLKDHGN